MFSSLSWIGFANKVCDRLNEVLLKFGLMISCFTFDNKSDLTKPLLHFPVSQVKLLSMHGYVPISLFSYTKPSTSNFIAALKFFTALERSAYGQQN